MRSISKVFRCREDCVCSKVAEGARPFVRLKREAAWRLREDDGGFSTLGMLIALLVTLALVFSTAQVYRVMSACADVQDVADATALAAQNEVAEFMVAVRVCDAISLSLSLTGLAALGLGVAALCTPVTASVSEVLLASGEKILSARNSFATKAAKGLNTLQKALPYMAAVQAMSVCAANNGTSDDADYYGIAVLVNGEGKDISIPDLEGIESLKSSIDTQKAEIQDAANEAEEAAKQANEAKEIAFESDCGNNPAYCMYERAESLAGLTGSSNPLYHSSDTWSFSAALNRAQAYYPARLVLEQASSYSSVKEQANSALRERFYRYAIDTIASGYVHESEDSFSAFFPTLPKNNSELRETVLYSEAIYPVTQNGEATMMHAYSGCPGAVGIVRYGSIAEMEEGDYEECPLCGFEVQSMGHIAAATTSTQSGFEHHYAVVAEQAALYQQAKNAQQPRSQAVKEKVSPLLDSVKELCAQAASFRIEAEPPGSYGAISLVANTRSSPASRGFENAFVESGTTLGMRAAVSGATIIEDASSEGRTVVSSLLDGLKDNAGIAVGVASVVLDLWSALLSAYGHGQDAVNDAIDAALSAIPFASASGLGTWASRVFRESVAGLGLQPAELNALKPVTVSSGSVAEGGSDVFAAKFLSVRKTALALSGGGSELFTSIAEQIGSAAFDALGAEDGRIELVAIEPLGSGGPSIPITIALPQPVVHASAGLLEQATGALRSLVRGLSGVRTWE